MDTDNQNKAPIRLKILHVNTAIGRFWSDAFGKKFHSERERWFMSIIILNGVHVHIHSDPCWLGLGLVGGIFEIKRKRAERVPFWGSLGRTLGPRVDFVLLEVLLWKREFKLSVRHSEPSAPFCPESPSLVPLLLRNAFKLVGNWRHLGDRRRRGVTSWNIDINARQADYSAPSRRAGGGGSLFSYQCGSKSTCMSWFKLNNVREARVLWLSFPHTHTRLRRRRETELVQWECRLLKLLAAWATRWRTGKKTHRRQNDKRRRSGTTIPTKTYEWQETAGAVAGGARD